MRDYYTPSNYPLVKIKLLAVVGGRVSSTKCQHSEGHHHHDGVAHSHDHMGHSHGHIQTLEHEPNRIFKIGIFVNLLFVVIEFYYGYKINSLALISDAFHNLTDVFALALAWIGYCLTQSKKNKKYSLYSALFNSLILILGSLWVIYEAIQRFNHPEVPAPKIMMLVAGIGFFVNFFSAQLFHKSLHSDLNMKSAYLHLMGDAAVSLGVVVTGAVLLFYNWAWLDPVVSFVISAVILIPAVQILKSSVLKLRAL
jgi:cobalt-zinc-cadmium efflux system protein